MAQIWQHFRLRRHVKRGRVKRLRDFVKPRMQQIRISLYDQTFKRRKPRSFLLQINHRRRGHRPVLSNPAHQPPPNPDRERFQTTALAQHLSNDNVQLFPEAVEEKQQI
uniref:(northern house mosquito) hypothetical protein n=1 Tax=Culex pipiens TaxID=7175 RepID=A0A8D8IXU9_CULPI